jgi:hypothetical protein
MLQTDEGMTMRRLNVQSARGLYRPGTRPLALGRELGWVWFKSLQSNIIQGISGFIIPLLFCK